MSADYGWILPEDVLAVTLGDGLADVDAAFTDNSIDDLLSRIYHNVPGPQLAQIKTWLAANSVPIIRGYPLLEQQKLPCWSILIDPEEISQQYLGNVGFRAQLTTGENAIVNAQRWRETIGIVTYADNPDLVRWLYQLSKWLLSNRWTFLAGVFRHSLTLSGRDLEPKRIEDSGRYIFRRVLQFVGELDQLDATRAPAIDISGFTGTQNADSQFGA